MKKYSEQWYQRFISKKYITPLLIKQAGGEIHQIGVIYKLKQQETENATKQNLKKTKPKIILKIGIENTP